LVPTSGEVLAREMYVISIYNHFIILHRHILLQGQIWCVENQTLWGRREKGWKPWRLQKKKNIM
jgi:hypothetical protein